MVKAKSSLGLGLLIIFCALLSIPAAVAWLVNIEIALQAVGVPCAWFGGVLPADWYGLLVLLSADFSTISTLVPLLLLAFPLFMGIRIRMLTAIDHGYPHRVVYDPYPPHFPFFLVMLGLAGTLYGLLIGLSVSGVSELGAQTPASASIQATIDRLMGGTATALLSSLLGLIGAFLAARPVPWIFRRLAGLPEEETQRELTEVVASLTRDLQALSHASREFGERLNVASADSIDRRLSHMETAIVSMAKIVDETNARFLNLTAVQERIADQAKLLKHLDELQRLPAIETAAAGASSHLAETRGAIDRLRAEQEKTRAASERMVEEFQRGHGESRQLLDRIQGLLDDSSRESREDRGAWRKALGQFVRNLTERS